MQVGPHFEPSATRMSRLKANGLQATHDVWPCLTHNPRLVK
jgi:hypothetical protein